jgi:hypothetical protein
VATLELPAEPTEPVIRRGRGRPRKHPVTRDYLTSANISAKQPPPIDISIIIQDTPFTDSRRKEINRLLKKGVFAAIIKKDVPQGVYIFNSRFVNKIKHPGTDKAFEKSRLVI